MGRRTAIAINKESSIGAVVDTLRSFFLYRVDNSYDFTFYPLRHKCYCKCNYFFYKIQSN